VTLDTSAEEVVECIREEGADLVGMSLTTRQWLRARDLAGAIAERVEVPVIAGGLHPTFSPEDVLASPGFEFVCLGEGEGALADLADALEQGSPTDTIANIWKRGGSRPALRPPVDDLDGLPFLDRGFLDEHPGLVHMVTQRGCPFPCTYCGARMFNQLYDGLADYGRRRSVGSVIEELQRFRESHPLSYVIFLDDTFTINHPWLREFCEVYPERLGVPFSVHARVETLNRDRIQSLAEAGCKHITYGVESGSPRVRREIMLRTATNERIRQVVEWTGEADIMVTANYMLGLPGETPEDLGQTLSLAADLGTDDFSYFVFYPYPGTRLFEVCREKGYLPADHLERPSNHRDSILDLPDLKLSEINAAYDRFTELRQRRLIERFGRDMPEDRRAALRDDVVRLADLG
jgi:radical SAM superfamily enzyme YgiQ (UPF0313 family)